MTSQRLTAVLLALCITSVTRGVSSCTGLVLTSSISGRNACLSEEVTFICTAQTTAVFWGNEEFGEKTMHYTSPRSRGEFRTEIVSYDRNQSCLVSSLSFRATASHNGTAVTCTSRDRSSSRSLSLHIMSNVLLENLTVVPDSSLSVELEWKVVPTDGHHCIRNYSIQIAGPNGSQWEEQIPGSNQSLNFTGLQLIPFEEYTYCVTANLLRGQSGLKVTANFTELQANLIGLNLAVNFTELQEPHPPTDLSAVVHCKQGYEIQIDWQGPLSDPLGSPLGSPLTGYLLEYHVYDNTSTIELPVLNTSYTLDSVPSGAVYNISVSALSDVGPSKNNPFVQFAVPLLICNDSLVIPEDSRMECTPQILIKLGSTDLDKNLCMADMAFSNECNCTTLLEKTNTPQECVEISNKNTSMNQLTLCAITAITSGVMSFACGSLLATICNCAIIQRKRARNKASKHVPTVSQHREQSPLYDDIIQFQNHCRDHNRENNAYVSPSIPTYATIK